MNFKHLPNTERLLSPTFRRKGPPPRPNLGAERAKRAALLARMKIQSELRVSQKPVSGEPST